MRRALRRLTRRFFFHFMRSPLGLLMHVYLFGHYYVMSYHENAVPIGQPWWTAVKVFRSPDATPSAATRWYVGGPLARLSAV